MTDMHETEVLPGSAIQVADAGSLGMARRLLLEDARHGLAIALPMLLPGSYDSEAELAALRRLATSGRHAGIRLLLHDPAGALRDGHRLILLAQRLPSAIQVRMPVAGEDGGESHALLLNDRGGYLRQVDPRRFDAAGHRDDRAGQAPWLRRFDEAWERAARARMLDPLGL